MTGSEPQTGRFFVDALAERLRQHRFTVGTDQCVRALELLEKVAPDYAGGGVATLLCPLFARSPEQQALFHEIFEKEFARGEEAPPATTAEQMIAAPRRRPRVAAALGSSGNRAVTTTFASSALGPSRSAPRPMNGGAAHSARIKSRLL